MSSPASPTDRVVDAARRRSRTAAGWLLHVGLVLSALLLLRGLSVPGVELVSAALGGGVFVLLLVAWLAVLGTRPPGHRRPTWWTAVAPVLTIVVVAAVALGVPERLRWSGSEAAFAAVVERLPPSDSGDWRVVRGQPRTIGSYDIREVQTVGSAVLFFESHGALLDDAGFAYLPAGPTTDLSTGWFESPELTHLGGPWYAFTAGW